MNDDLLKVKMCNDLIRSGLVKEYDIFDSSYIKNLNDIFITTNQICPTLKTRCDLLGVVVKYDKNRQEKTNKSKK